MRIVTWNLNGIRAAIRKGLDDFVEALEPDVLMLQEIRALPEQLPADWTPPSQYQVLWHPAQRKGYAGVSTWSAKPMEELSRGMNREDPEGRVLRTRSFGIDFINVYLPSGAQSEERQARKDAWLDEFLPWACSFLDAPYPVILAGDLNIAHTKLDIHNPSGNKRNSGFLPHERDWFTQLLASGWTDLFRSHVGDRQGPYSWWSNRGRARELDRGWRIDYVLGNSHAAKRLTSAHILREGGLVVSDHAPVIVDLDMT